MRLKKGEMAINPQGTILMYLGGLKVKCIKKGTDGSSWKVGEICQDYDNVKDASTFLESIWKRHYSFKDYLKQVEQL